jgi:hypothetical protein
VCGVSEWHRQAPTVGEALANKGRCVRDKRISFSSVKPLKLNDPYRGRALPLTSKRCILYIYSTNIRTEYFKHGIYSPFFSSSKCSLFHNSNVFGCCIIHILCTGCAYTL